MKRTTTFISSEDNDAVNKIVKHSKRKNRTFVETNSSQQDFLGIKGQQNLIQARLKFQTKTIVDLLINDFMLICLEILEDRERDKIVQNAVESCNQLFHTQNWQLHPTTPSVLRNQYESLVPDQQPQKKEQHPMLGFNKVIRQKTIQKIVTLGDSRKKNNRTKKSSSKMLSIKSNRSSILSTLSRKGQSTQKISAFVSKLVPLNLNVDTNIQMNQTRRIQDILRDKKNTIEGNNNFSHLKGKVFFTSVDDKDKQSVNLNNTTRQVLKDNEQSRTSRGYAINLSNTTSSKLAQLRTNVHTSRQEYNYDENGDALAVIKRQNKIKNIIKVVKTTYNIINCNENDKTGLKKIPKRQILNVRLKPVKKVSAIKQNDIPLGEIKKMYQEDELKSGLQCHFLKQRAHFRQLDQDCSQPQNV